LREESRFRVLGKRVLRRIFGPKTGEVTGEWRKLNTEEVTQFCSGVQINKFEMGGA
jgi:hypothetical protein